MLTNIKNVILVASGKGGVGKSTVAANLAVTLSREGYATGIMDADLYGPSIPINLGISEQRPAVKKDGDREGFEPVENYGVKIMSLGLLMNKEDAVIWRGPLASKALTQMLEGTNWGQLDFLIIDMPPGTGDINITIAQKLPQAKAIVVVSPQEVAIADGRKAAAMFKTNGIDIPVLGVVENMSYFVPEKHPDERYFLFGKGGGKKLSVELNVPMLAKIPLVADVCELGDAGKTIFASSDKIIVEVFQELACKLNQENMVVPK